MIGLETFIRGKQNQRSHYFPNGRQPQKTDFEFLAKSESLKSESSKSVSSDSESTKSVSSKSVSSRAEQWEALRRQAEAARNNKKLKRATTLALILQLCTGIYLSADELARLLNRETKTIRDTYIIPLKKEGRLVEKYQTSTHPDQRYTTNPAWVGEA